MPRGTVLDPFKPGKTEAGSRNGSTPPPPRALQIETMTVTPDMAVEWVARNTRNRPVRYSRVTKFARDMKAGKWDLNGETIKIAADDAILDGQHRLYACIQAEVPFEVIVITGLPAEVQDTIDTGAARTMGDQFGLHGEANSPLLAAVTRWLWKWQRGVKMQGQAEEDPTHSEMIGFLAANPGLREAAAWAAHARGTFKSVPGSVWGMAWMLFHTRDADAAGSFLEKAMTGEDCPAGDPALAFRNRIWRAREEGERLAQYEQLGYMIMAWNAFRDGRPLHRCQPPRGGFTPKTFPEPK